MDVTEEGQAYHGIWSASTSTSNAVQEVTLFELSLLVARDAPLLSQVRHLERSVTLRFHALHQLRHLRSRLQYLHDRLAADVDPLCIASSELTERDHALKSRPGRSARSALAKQLETAANRWSSELQQCEAAWQEAIREYESWSAGPSMSVKGLRSEDDAALPSWLDRLKESSADKPSTKEVLLRSLRRLLNRPLQVAASIAALQVDVLKQLLEVQGTPPSTSMHAIFLIILDSQGIGGLAAFSERLLLGLCRRILESGSEQQSVEGCVLRILDEVQSFEINMPLHQPARCENLGRKERPCRKRVCPLVGPSRQLELALLAHLRAFGHHSSSGSKHARGHESSRNVSAPLQSHAHTSWAQQRQRTDSLSNGDGSKSTEVGASALKNLSTFAIGAADVFATGLGTIGSSVTHFLSSPADAQGTLGEADNAGVSSAALASSPGRKLPRKTPPASLSMSRFVSQPLKGTVLAETSQLQAQRQNAIGMPGVSEDDAVAHYSPTAPSLDAQQELRSQLPQMPRRRVQSDAGRSITTASIKRVPSASGASTFMPKPQSGEKSAELIGSVTVVLRALMGYEGTDGEGPQHRPLIEGAHALPLAVHIIRRLLCEHFAPQDNPAAHRQILLLVVLRWYAFGRLRQIITKPHLWASGHCDSVTSPLRQQSRGNTGQYRALRGAWLSDIEATSALGELHRATYAAIVTALDAEAGLSRESGTAPHHSPEARELVGLFRTASAAGPDSSSARPPFAAARHADTEAEPTAMTVLGLRLTDGLALLQGCASLLVTSTASPTPQTPTQRSPTLRVVTKALGQNSHSALDTSDNRVGVAATPIEASHVQKAIEDVQAAIAGRQSKLASSRDEFALVFVARRDDGTYALQQTASGLSNVPASTLVSQHAAGISASAPGHVDAGSETAISAAVPFPGRVTMRSRPHTSRASASTMTPSNSGSSFSSRMDPSEASGARRGWRASAESGWDSPPHSPDQQDLWDLDAMRDHPSPLDFRQRVHTSNTSPLARRLSLSGQRVSSPPQSGEPRSWQTARAASFGPMKASSSSPAHSTREGTLQTFQALPGPIFGLTRRAVMTLVRKSYSSGAYNTGRPANLIAAMHAAATTAAHVFAYDDAALLDEAGDALVHVSQRMPHWASGAEGPLSFGPLLGLIAQPLLTAQDVMRSRLTTAHARLSDIGALRHSMTESARDVLTAMHELRVKAWYAVNIRLEDAVLASRGTARTHLARDLAEERVSRPAVPGSTAEEQECGRTWLQGLGLHDFGLEPRHIRYLQDLDGAFGVIAGKAEDFFACPIWGRESVLAQPLLQGSAEQGDAHPETAVLTSGACSAAFLLPGEAQAHDRIGLEEFLQRSQLLATSLLLSEALPPVIASGGVFCEVARTDEEYAEVPLASRAVANEVREAGAAELLRVFELHPAPRVKMRALLTLEKLIVSVLSRQRCLVTEIERPSQQSAHETLPGKTGLPFPVDLRSRAHSNADSTDTVGPLSATTSAHGQRSDRGSVGTIGSRPGPLSRPLSVAKARRALSMYSDLAEDLPEEAHAAEGVGVPGIHDVLGESSLAVTRGALAARSATTGSETYAPDEDYCTPQSPPLAARPCDLGAAITPTTDDVVGVLEALLRDSRSRPRNLLLNLQVIACFTPTNLLDYKDEVSFEQGLRDPVSSRLIALNGAALP